MERIVILMWLIFAGAVTGLVLTADNEPEAPIKPPKFERTHLTDGVPNNDNDTIIVIKNPLR